MSKTLASAGLGMVVLFGLPAVSSACGWGYGGWNGCYDSGWGSRWCGRGWGYNDCYSPCYSYNSGYYSTPTYYSYSTPAYYSYSTPTYYSYAASSSMPLVGEEEQDVAVNGPAPARVDMRVPANAEIWFEGDKTSQTGSNRHFVSPTLQPGRDFSYDIKARWMRADGQVVEQTRQVKVEAGQRVLVDFTRS